MFFQDYLLFCTKGEKKKKVDPCAIMVFLLLPHKKKPKTKGPTVMMLTQRTNEMQEFLNNVLRDIPIVLGSHSTHTYLYYLVKGISQDLEDFILTGGVHVKISDRMIR